jgi:hypothetical protein
MPSLERWLPELCIRLDRESVDRKSGAVPARVHAIGLTFHSCRRRVGSNGAHDLTGDGIQF